MAGGHWSLDDIPWEAFDASKVDRELLKVVKAASLVEYNGRDYAAYLRSVFPNDLDFQRAAETWAEEMEFEELEAGDELIEEIRQTMRNVRIS